MDELTIGDKIYISSKQAAKITGYAKDYVGQLCREGRVEARLVGRNWYVLETSIREHRFGAGEAAKEPASVAVEEPKASPVSAWEAPKYAPVEEEALMPPIEPQKRTQTAPQTAEAVALMQDAWKEWFQTREQIMSTPQPASSEPEEPRLEVEESPVEEMEEEVRISDIPNVYAADEVSQPEGEEERIMLSRIHEPVVEEPYEPEPVPVSRPLRSAPRAPGSVVDLTQARIVHEEVYVPKSRPIRSAPQREVRGARRARGSLVLQASLIAIAGLTAAIAVVGSGVLESAATAQGLNDSLRGAIFETLRGETRVER